MTMRTTNGNKRHLDQPDKKPENFSKQPSWIKPLASSIPEPGESSQTVVTRTEVAPKSRIVVVRATSRAQEEESDANKNKQAEQNSVQLPAVLTNRRSSVYLIRRSIPPNRPFRETKLFKRSEEDPATEIPLDANLILPSQFEPSSSHRRRLEDHSFSKRFQNQEDSSTGFDTSGLNVHRLRSISRTKNQSPFDLRRHSRSQRRTSSTYPTEEEFQDRKSTAIQVDLISSETAQNQKRKPRLRQPGFKNSRRRTSPSEKVKSSKSIVLVNPDNQTIAMVENPYMKTNFAMPIVQTHPSSSKGYSIKTNDKQYVANSYKKSSQLERCVGCLSNRICLVLTLCIVCTIIGLGGTGVSVYFLITNSQASFIPTIIGIVIGCVIAITALCFLCCVLACIGSRYGYFSYNDDNLQIGGRVFAVIPPNYRNAHLYIPYENRHIHKKQRRLSSVPQQQANTNRQRTIMSDSINTTNRRISMANDLNSTTNTKNITIQMPESLLTTGKISPKSRERKVNDVVNNIGRIVEDTKKWYKDDLPTKVIVQVDDVNKSKN